MPNEALDGQGKIVGGTFCLEIMKDWEVQLMIGDVNTPSQRFSADQHPPDWVVFMTKQILDLMRNES